MRRFEAVSGGLRRFEEVVRRFEEVVRRFEEVVRRFETHLHQRSVKQVFKCLQCLQFFHQAHLGGEIREV